MIRTCPICQKQPLSEGRELCYACDVMMAQTDGQVQEAVARRRADGPGDDSAKGNSPMAKRRRAGACAACGSTKRRIHGRGLCTTCYFRQKKTGLTEPRRRTGPRAATRSSARRAATPSAAPRGGKKKAGVAPDGIVAEIRRKAQEQFEAAKARYERLIEACELLDQG